MTRALPAPVQWVDAAHLAKRTGRTVRYWQRMAGEKKIDFATQPGGPGTSYYYDLAAFEAWFAAGGKKKTPWQPAQRKARGSRTSGGGTDALTAEWKKTASRTESPLKQAIRKSLASVLNNG